MRLAEAVVRLRNAGVPDWFYVTDGGLGTGECVGVEQVPGGGQSTTASAAGSRRWRAASMKDAACRALLRHVDQMMRQSGRSGLAG
jgi:hypothetical protein